MYWSEGRGTGTHNSWLRYITLHFITLHWWSQLKPADELEHIIYGYLYIVYYITLYYILLRASVENSKPADAYCYWLIPCRHRHFNQHYRITNYLLSSSFVHSPYKLILSFLYKKSIYHTSGPIALYYTTDTESLQRLARKKSEKSHHPPFIYLFVPAANSKMSWYCHMLS